MKDLAYHFGNGYDKDVVFGFPSHVHFGDRITCLNVIKTLNIDGYKVNPHTPAGRELCSYFFDESILTDLPVTHHFHSTPDTLTDAYQCRYFKIKGDEVVREKKYITYSFECITNAGHKPPYLDELITILKQKYGEDTVVSVGLHIEEDDSRLKNTLKYMLQSKVFIGMDSGLAHLCRCTSIPMVILEHTNDIERAHSELYCDRFKGKSMESIVEYVDKIMIQLNIEKS